MKQTIMPQPLIRWWCHATQPPQWRPEHHAYSLLHAGRMWEPRFPHQSSGPNPRSSHFYMPPQSGHDVSVFPPRSCPSSGSSAPVFIMELSLKHQCRSLTQSPKWWLWGSNPDHGASRCEREISMRASLSASHTPSTQGAPMVALASMSFSHSVTKAVAVGLQPVSFSLLSGVDVTSAHTSALYSHSVAQSAAVGLQPSSQSAPSVDVMLAPGPPSHIGIIP